MFGRRAALAGLDEPPPTARRRRRADERRARAVARDARRRCGATPAWSARRATCARCSTTRTRSPGSSPPARPRPGGDPRRPRAARVPATTRIWTIGTASSGRGRGTALARPVDVSVFRLTSTSTLISFWLNESAQCCGSWVARPASTPARGSERRPATGAESEGVTSMYQLQSRHLSRARGRDPRGPPVRRRSDATTSASCARARPPSTGSPRTGTTSPGRRKTLFNDIRIYFPMSAQRRVYHVVDRYLRFAREYLATSRDSGFDLDGQPARVPRDHAPGHAVPAHAAAAQRLLPVAPAPGRDRGGRARRSPPRADDGARRPRRSVRAAMLLGSTSAGPSRTPCSPSAAGSSTAKAPTTPDDQSEGVLAAVARRAGARRRAAPATSRRSPTARPSPPTRCWRARARAPCSSPPRASRTSSSSAARPAPTSTGCARRTRRRSCRPSAASARPSG